MGGEITAICHAVINFMLDYIDTFTITTIEMVNFLLLTTWFLFFSTQYIAKVLRAFFNIGRATKKYDD
jgi:hypothetical protein